MRAFKGWLAPVLLLLAATAGCVSFHPSPSRDGSAQGLSGSDRDMAEALAHYSQALISEITPGGFEESFRQLGLAVEHDPANFPLTLKLAAGHLAHKDYTQAVAVLSRGVEAIPESVDVRLLLGAALQMSGDLRGANREYRTVVRLAPRRSEGYVRLATLAMAESRYGRARAWLDDGRRQVDDPESVLQILDTMGRLLLLNDQAKDAAGFFESILASKPADPAARELLARCHAVMGKRRQAIAELTALVKDQPDNGPIAFLLGELYESDENDTLSEAYYDKAAHAKTAEPVAYLRLAHVQLRTGPARAQATLEEAAKRFPDDPSLYAYLGLLYSRERRFDKAVECFARVEKLLAVPVEGGQKMLPTFYFWYGTALKCRSFFYGTHGRAHPPTRAGGLQGYGR